MKILLLLFCFIPAMANAYDIQRAQTNLASDYATCAAYYMITTHILNDNGRNSTAAEAAAKNAVNMAVTLSNRKVTTARVELTTGLIMQEMENDLSNWAVIVNKYGKACSEITENPDQRLNYWLNKK
jgi:hypothetical protein